LFKKKGIERFKRNESSELKGRIVSRQSKEHLKQDNQAKVPIKQQYLTKSKIVILSRFWTAERRDRSQKLLRSKV
jgi:hypothetical protein